MNHSKEDQEAKKDRFKKRYKDFDYYTNAFITYFKGTNKDNEDYTVFVALIKDYNVADEDDRDHYLISKAFLTELSS